MNYTTPYRHIRDRDILALAEALQSHGGFERSPSACKPSSVSDALDALRASLPSAYRATNSCWEAIEYHRAQQAKRAATAVRWRPIEECGTLPGDQPVWIAWGDETYPAIYRTGGPSNLPCFRINTPEGSAHMQLHDPYLKGWAIRNPMPFTGLT